MSSAAEPIVIDNSLMMPSRAGIAVAVSVLLTLLTGPAAWAEDARVLQEKAKKAFALSRYAEAAEGFEKAFELKGDPVLLFNAAQSHRLGGNKERALSLYQNYLRVFGNDERRDQIETYIAELKKAIGNNNKVPDAGAPNAPEPSAGAPVTPLALGSSATPGHAAEPPLGPMAATPAVSTETPVRLAEPGSAPAVVAQPAAEPAAERPLTRRPWFWVGVGGAVVAAVVVVLLVAGGSKDPSPSIGSLDSN
jgi:tetratricopeptide (TPR) repeat protein